MKPSDEDAGALGSRRGQVAGQKIVNLALQGGGSHGAFTWGVLDRILEEEPVWTSKVSPRPAPVPSMPSCWSMPWRPAGRESSEACAGELLEKGVFDLVSAASFSPPDRQGESEFRP